MTELLATLFLLAGVLLILTGAIGVARLPDLFCRAHALTKAMTLGILLMLVGLGFQLGSAEAGLKVTLAIFFQFLTLPVAGHLIALTAFKQNAPRWKQRPMDDHRR